MIFYYGLTDNDGKFTWMNLAKITTPENLKALGLALLLAFVSTVICLILAYPLAMILVGRNVNQSSFVVLVFILPMWMNFLLRTLAWQNLLEKNGVINSVLQEHQLPLPHPSDFRHQKLQYWLLLLFCMLLLLYLPLQQMDLLLHQ